MARLSGTRKGQVRKTSRRAYTPKRRTTTRRRRTTKKGMLSELFNPKMSSAGAKTVLSGAVGGVGAGLLDKILESNVADDKTLQNNGGYLQDNGYLMDNSMGMQNEQSEYSYGVGYFPGFGQA